MKSRSSKWACAALGLMLAIGFLPALASAQGTVTAGTATQVGFPLCPPNQHCPGGKGQVRISGTFDCPPFPDLDLRQCDLVINKILFDSPNELVHADRCMFVDSDPNTPLQIGARGSSKDAIFEVGGGQRPTCRMQIKNRGRGVCEFQLKVDRAVIDTPSADPVSLETAFDLVDAPGKICGASISTFDATAHWREGTHPDEVGNWRVRP